MTIPNLTHISEAIRRRLMLLSPAVRRTKRDNLARRTECLALLDAFARVEPVSRVYDRVLVDGQWDNANYWIRYALLRRALGLHAADEIGVLGHFSRERSAAAFRSYGFGRVIDHGRYFEKLSDFRDAARAIRSRLVTADDLLAVDFPTGIPATIIYDGILKRQRRAVVDLHDPKFLDYLAEALSAIDVAEHLIGRERPNLVVLSHVTDFAYGSIAWAAIRREIPVIVLYGEFGVNRFLRLSEPKDMFAYPIRPSRQDESSIEPGVAAALRAAGADYLTSRLGGRTDDISAIYAYGRRTATVSRAEVAARYGWNPQTPIVGIYSPNWFDYPNASGRFPFRDFHDWVTATLEVARGVLGINFLFKAHPCDEWYGHIKGDRLSDILARARAPNCGLCDTSWNGLDLFRCLDALVTVHGTAGMEAAGSGLPALVPYSGWYGDFGFVRAAASRDEYLDLLRQQWWQSTDKNVARERAHQFMGWYFCAPDWQDGFFLEDDAAQDAVWRGMASFLADHDGDFRREIDELRLWMESGHRYFHIFKMRRARNFVFAKARESAGIPGDPRLRQLAPAK